MERGGNKWNEGVVVFLTKGTADWDKIELNNDDIEAYLWINRFIEGK